MTPQAKGGKPTLGGAPPTEQDIAGLTSRFSPEMIVKTTEAYKVSR